MSDRRVVLEEQHNSYTSLGWMDDGALHLARPDVGDSFDLGDGMDIPDPGRFLQWLAADRFTGMRANDELLAYCARRGIAVTSSPVAAPSRTAWAAARLAVDGDEVLVDGAPPGDERSALFRIDGWRELILELVLDRCQGRSAWNRVQEELASAGVVGEPRWRGYV